VVNIPDTFDVNVIKHIHDSHTVDFRTDKDVIGSSQQGFCGRRVIGEKIQGVSFKGNLKTDFGNIFEGATSKDYVIENILWDIYQQTGIKIQKSSIRPFQGKPQKELYVKVRGEQLLRMHPDFYTNKYCIEEKTTHMNRRAKGAMEGWDNILSDIKKMGQDSEKIIQRHVAQLNMSLINFKHEIGFLYTYNGNAFITGMSEGVKRGLDYWDRVHNAYEFFIPIYPNQELYDYSFERVKKMFIGIETHNLDMFEDCEFDWECRGCLVREMCGKDEYICQHVRDSGSKCSEKLYEFSSKLTEAFIENPICEYHYNELYPRRDYLKYKTGIAIPKQGVDMA